MNQWLSSYLQGTKSLAEGKTEWATHKKGEFTAHWHFLIELTVFNYGDND